MNTESDSRKLWLIYFNAVHDGLRLQACCDFIGFSFNLMLLEIILHLPVVDIHITAGVEQPVSVINIFNHFPLSVSTAAGCVSLRRNAARRSISLRQNTPFCSKIVPHGVFLC